MSALIQVNIELFLRRQIAYSPTDNTGSVINWKLKPNRRPLSAQTL